MGPLREAGLPGETIPQLLAHHARTRPGQTFMRHKQRGIWRRYTFAEVYGRVRRLALGMAALGVRRGETVALLGENEPELYLAEFAALAIGARVVAIFPDALPAEVAYMLKDSQARLVVAEDQEQVDKLLEIKADVPEVIRAVYWDPRGMWQYGDPWLLALEELERLGNEEEPDRFDRELEQGAADDWAVLSYTSGTTGEPKAAILTHRGMIDNALRLVDGLGIRPQAQYLTFISLAWAAEQYLGIALGLVAPLVVNFPEEPETVLADLREIGAEVVLFSPRQWESLVADVEARMLHASRLRRAWYRWAVATGERCARDRHAGRSLGLARRLALALAERTMLASLRDRLGLAHVRTALSAGSALAPDVFRFFHGLGVPLRNLYGMTEVGLLTVHMGDRVDPETVGNWLPVRQGVAPPLEWRVTEEGELLVRGGTPFAGYFRRPEATAAKVDPEGWYHTGDAVYVRPDGQLVYLDRLEDLRELASGHRYPPQYIETRLRFSPYIRDVAVLGDRERPFVAALVDIDPETVGKWAAARRVNYTTHADLSQRPEVIELIRAEVARVNRNLPPEMRVRRFAIMPKPFDPDEAELTRTRKLRRGFFEQRYRELIEALYGGHPEYAPEVPVRYRDGRTGVVRVPMRFCDVDD